MASLICQDSMKFLKINENLGVIIYLWRQKEDMPILIIGQKDTG
nr:MAG TPA: hypothetical protein [Crassvirales sp.]